MEIKKDQTSVRLFMEIKKALAHELTDVVELYIKTQIYMMLQQLCLLNEL